jgi:hypothetical protein
LELLSKSTQGSIELRQNDGISLPNSLRQGNSTSRSRRGSPTEFAWCELPGLPPEQRQEAGKGCGKQ